jgi:hypothetical protein
MKPFNITTWQPSDYLEAMVVGLQELDNRPDFTILMTTFGFVEIVDDRKICFGCAANAAICEIIGTQYPDVIASLELGNLPPHWYEDDDHYDASFEAAWSELFSHEGPDLGFSGFDRPDWDSLDVVKALEAALDKARQGSLWRLFHFCSDFQPKGAADEIISEGKTRWDRQWHLTTTDWADGIPVIEATIAEMRSVGF